MLLTFVTTQRTGTKRYNANKCKLKYTALQTAISYRAAERIASCSTLASSAQRTMIVSEIPSVAVCLQQLTVCLVYNSCGLTPNRTPCSINVQIFSFETRKFPPSGRLARIWMRHGICDANFLMFHRNYGSILLSFRDDHGTDNGYR